MAVRKVLSVLVAVLLLAVVSGSPVDNKEESFISRDLRARNFRARHNNNIIGFNTHNNAMPHLANNFNRLSSSSVLTTPVFRPMHSNRNTFSPVVFPSNTFRRPGPSHNFNIGAFVPAQPTANSFTNRRSPPSTTATTFGNAGNRRSNTAVSFSNKPNVNSPEITFADRHAPISFGNGGGMDFPGTPTFFSNRRRVVQPTDSVNTDRSIAPSRPSTATVTDDGSFGKETFFNIGHLTVPSGSPAVDMTDIPSATEVFRDPSDSPLVFFPALRNVPRFETDRNTPDATDISLMNDGNCELEHRQILFNDRCSILLQQGPCPSDHWLILSDDGTPFCSERPCPWDKLHYRGSCVDPSRFDICREGQILYVDLSGDVECDCEEDFIYDPSTRNCIAEHEQGSCQHTYFMERDREEQISCVPNPCMRDGYVAHQGKCYPKNYRGYCPPDQVMILEDNTADCLFIVPHSIFEVPTLRACPSGSRRDFFHKCRAVFRVPSQATFRSLKGECPPSFIRDPRGTCRKVVSLFG